MSDLGGHGHSEIDRVLGSEKTSSVDSASAFKDEGESRGEEG